MAVREEIVAAARAWIGTPYIHQASLRGHGCDCLGLLAGVWRDLGGEVPPLPAYSPDWGESDGGEALAEGLRLRLDEIDRALMAPGDIALFRMRRGFPAKHCGIVAKRDGWDSIIHARMGSAVAEETLTRPLARLIAHVFRVPGV